MSHFRFALRLTFAAASLTASCAFETTENPGDQPIDSVSDEPAEVAQAFTGTNPVGIIPTDGRCPNGSDKVSFKMDIEDVPSGDFSSWLNGFSSPWVERSTFWTDAMAGGTYYAGKAMTLTFCRVDGNVFKPINADINLHDEKSYAVLKLGSTCPPNSSTQGIWIDTEDRNNTNSASGPFSPNTSSSSGVQLYFCVFYWASSGTMSSTSFPKYTDVNGGAVPYAVLHDFDSAQRSWVMYKKWEWFDDEDGEVAGFPSTTITPNKTKYSPAPTPGLLFDPFVEFSQMVSVMTQNGNHGIFFEWARVR